MKLNELIKQIEGVYVAVVPEEEEGQKVWNVYIINDRSEPITNVMLTSKGYGTVKKETVKTSTLRRALPDISAKQAVKAEFIPRELHGLSNEYWLSFYLGRDIFDKKYIFLPESLIEKNLIDVPLVHKKGVLVV